jgi:DUF1365 family protein
VPHKTGFAALPAPDLKCRCFSVQVWDLFQFLSKDKMETGGNGKAEMERVNETET